MSAAGSSDAGPRAIVAELGARASVPLDEYAPVPYDFDGVAEEPPPPRLSVNAMSLRRAGRVILDNVSFTVAAGEVFGLLGPNGAGKSSLMRCITGLWAAERGTLWVDGVSISNRSRVLRSRLGVVFQEPSLDAKLTARENLLLGARLFAVPRQEAARRASELLEFMELTERGDDPVHQFSGGMRRRLELARALVHRPSVLVLDEPTVGLDPVACERTWQRLLALRHHQGLTIVTSTHGAEEAARCDRLLVFDRGRVVVCDTPAALLARCGGDIITLEASEAAPIAAALCDELATLATVRLTGASTVVVECEAGHQLIPRLVEMFEPGRLRSVSLRRPSLADAFFKLTGSELEADTPPVSDDGATASGGAP